MYIGWSIWNVFYNRVV